MPIIIKTLSVTRKAGKKIDEKTKAQAVMYYHTCKNTAETARKYAVSRRTILRWVEECSDIVAVTPAAQDAYVRAIEDASAIRLTFLREHYDGLSEVIKKAIIRANNLIDKADSLGTVVNAIERLSTVIKDFAPSEESTPSPTINLLQQTINKDK